jgi:hypothetical protein
MNNMNNNMNNILSTLNNNITHILIFSICNNNNSSSCKLSCDEIYKLCSTFLIEKSIITINNNMINIKWEQISDNNVTILSCKSSYSDYYTKQHGLELLNMFNTNFTNIHMIGTVLKVKM